MDLFVQSPRKYFEIFHTCNHFIWYEEPLSSSEFVCLSSGRTWCVPTVAGYLRFHRPRVPYNVGGTDAKSGVFVDICQKAGAPSKTLSFGAGWHPGLSGGKRTWLFRCGGERPRVCRGACALHLQKGRMEKPRTSESAILPLRWNIFITARTCSRATAFCFSSSTSEGVVRDLIFGV